MALRIPVILALALAAGCAQYGSNLKPGQSVRGDVEREMGRPTLVQEAPNGERTLWYSMLPLGRASYAVRIGADERVIAVEQRLSPEFIQKVIPGQTTADEALAILGPPWRSGTLPRKNREVWEYPIDTHFGEHTLFVEVSADRVVRDRYQINDRHRLMFAPGVFFGFGF